jgi:MscS family membrane protein
MGNIAVWQFIGLALTLLLGFSARWLVQFTISFLKYLLRHSNSPWRDRILEAGRKPLGLAITSIIWLLCIHLLQFEGLPLRLMILFCKLLLTISLIWIASALCDLFKTFLSNFPLANGQPLDPQISQLISRCLKIFVLVTGILLGAQNLGIEVFSVLAGLGIGGLALALAAKDTLANLFGSIMIMIDRPFRLGHSIRIHNLEGVVEDIGFRSTRIRSPENALISIANSELALATITNLSLRPSRRIVTTLGLTYNTKPEQLRQFIQEIHALLKQSPLTQDEKNTVTFKHFAASSLDLELIFFIHTDDNQVELEERQKIYLGILELAEKLQLSFAFPTQTLHIESTAPKT